MGQGKGVCDERQHGVAEQDGIEDLEWNLSTSAVRVGATVQDGAATRADDVPAHHARRADRRTAGLVTRVDASAHPDDEIARAAIETLERKGWVLVDWIQVSGRGRDHPRWGCQPGVPGDHCRGGRASLGGRPSRSRAMRRPSDETPRGMRSGPAWCLIVAGSDSRQRPLPVGVAAGRTNSQDDPGCHPNREAACQARPRSHAEMA